MADSSEELARQVHNLSTAITDLQRRVVALERCLPSAATEQNEPGSEHLGVAAVHAAMSIGPGTPAAAARNDNLAALFGWALLGMAGAYLLRALTESGRIPGLAGAIMGILYAGWWLYLAARRAGEEPVVSTVNGVTAALILSPMLFEVTIRFHLLNATVASAVLVLFAVWGLAIGHRRKVSAVGWIGTLAALVTLSALFRESQDAEAWVASTLLIAAAVELSACRDAWLSLRWVVALFADFLLLAVTFVLARSAPADLVIGAQLGLAAIYIASTIDRTIIRQKPIAWLEIAQLVVAFSIALYGNLGAIAGVACVLAGALCYTAAFGLFHAGRNFFAYSTFAIVLVSLGASLLFSGSALAGAAVALAVAAMWLPGRRTLTIHGIIYLLLAFVAAGAFPDTAARVVRTGVPPALTLAYMLALAGALVCYWRSPKTPLEAFVPAALACAGLTGLLAAPLSAGPLRTALLTALAVGCAWCGKRWGCTELVWLIWPLLGAAAVKAVFEDIHQGSLTIFLSFLCGAVALILLSRLLRQRTGVVVDNPPSVRAAAQH